MILSQLGSVSRPKDWSKSNESNKERKRRRWKEIQRSSETLTSNIENGLQDRCYWSKSAKLNLNFSGEKRRERRVNSTKNFVSC